MHGLYGMPALNPAASRSPALAHLSGNVFEATHGTGRLEQLQQTLGCENRRDCRQKSDRPRCFCHSERSEAESKNLTLRLVLSSPKNQGCFDFAQHDSVVGLGRLTGE
jgi:hypothetical protein